MFSRASASELKSRPVLFMSGKLEGALSSGPRCSRSLRRSMGIPHVRYRVTHLKDSRTVPDGLRILALSCFAERFRRIGHAA